MPLLLSGSSILFFYSFHKAIHKIKICSYFFNFKNKAQNVFMNLQKLNQFTNYIHSLLSTPNSQYISIYSHKQFADLFMLFFLFLNLTFFALLGKLFNIKLNLQKAQPEVHKHTQHESI